jgi:hypothetical protein
MKILKYILILVVLSLVIFLALQTKTTNKTDTVPPQNIITDIKQNVENYLRENISKLSPVKAVLGGTWYVISVTTDLEKKSGTVTYEDGHIQEIKNFLYTANDKGEIVSLTIIDSSGTGSTSKKGGITGTVTLGPTCPVERIPPDPNCAPKFYSTSINIIRAGDNKIIKTIQSDSNGTFGIDLDQGSYILQAQGGNVLPRCPLVTVDVKSGQYITTNISCDTGIR